MSFGLLTPLFLAGLAALAIPILVHLVRREEHMSFRFPSLMFLAQIPVREHRRRTIRHWWLLALRCLIIALVCLAFARPFIEWPAQATVFSDDSRDRVVLLDRSHSMQAGSRWNDALALAREAIDELGTGDRGALVLFDHETLVAEKLGDSRAALRAALAGARTGDGHTDLVGALARAGALLEASTAATREVVLISDFQRSGVDPRSRAHLAAGIVVTPKPVTGPAPANATVATVKLDREPLGDGDAVELDARIVNTGEQPISDTELVMEVDAQERERRILSLAPGETRDEVFRLVLAPQELLRVRIHVGEDGLPADNAHHLLVSGRSSIPVLLVRDRRARPQTAPHLEEALRQGNEPGFRVTTRSASQLGESDFDAVDVVIIDDAPIPGGVLGQRLRRFIVSGGGLLVVSGGRVKGTWPGGEDGLVPGRLGAPINRPGADAARILGMKTLHPALAGFDSTEGGNLASAQIFRYRGLADVDEPSVLARYDDGNVAIAERRVGNGRVLVITTTLDPSWNTLAMQPGFLPLVHESLKYLASHVPAARAVHVGDTVDLTRYARGISGYGQSALALTRGALSTLRTPSGRTINMPAGEAFPRMREAGFHEAHVSGGGASSLVIAVNPRPRESDLTALDAREFVESIDADPPGGESADATATRGSGTDVNRSVWWYLVLACVVLLGLDTLISNRLSRSERLS